MRTYPKRVAKYVAGICFFFLLCHLLFNSESANSSGDKMIAYDEDVVKSYEDEALNTEEAKRTGPGEQGKAVVLDAAEMEIAKNYINQNGFNTYISDKIAVDRSVGDIRLPQCKTMKYLAHLPSVSVVIPFFQEHWNVLLRTFITVLKRAPKDVIKEVILVDDGSWREHLLGRLDDYLRQNYPDGKVRVVRHQKREGLIRARITGAKAASGEILLFLDSHCEPTVNYLPPLIDPIVRNYRTVTCPFIDTIHADTFEYMGGNDGMRGVFNWELQYKGLPKLQKDVEFPERPFESPVMAGGLFAISAKWFWELGGYDPELQIWGGEQFEISFKLWQCGGSMFDIPCSHIGHIYRGHPTDFPNNPVPGDFIGRNFKRVALVWMDDYIEHLYNRRPHYRTLDAGDLSKQYAVRQRLQCKPFKWYMERVAFDVPKHFPFVEPTPDAKGDVRVFSAQSYCMQVRDSDPPQPIHLSRCARDGNPLEGVQDFQVTFHGDVRPVNWDKCFDRADNSGGVILFPCHEMMGNQHFVIVSVHNNNQNPVLIKHPPSDTCLEAHLSEGLTKVINTPCSLDNSKQYWVWQTLQLEAAKESRLKLGL